MSTPLRALFLPIGSFLALIALSAPAHAGEDWLPITPEELRMTSEPKAPGAPAIYLYRQVDRDDVKYREYHYARIKIFTEEGRKYADVEIPFWKGHEEIKDIQARTVQPDGSILNFDEKIYENVIVKAKGAKYLAKTFTLPNVQVGSIVEYRYRRNFSVGYVDSQWLLSGELFTKDAKFSLRRAGMALAWTWPRGLPEGTSPPQDDHQAIRLETHDVPAFQIEDYMPPPDEMKYRVEFRYILNVQNDADKFWKEEGQRLSRGIDSFIDKRKAMEQAVAQIVAPTDPPDEKLRKIYSRCQKIRNLDFDPGTSESARSREKLEPAQNVADIWKHGYGNAWEITWLFLALVRAAGFEADPLLVSTRDRHLFNPKLMNLEDLNANLVLVRLNGKDLFLDPGIAFAPFGLLPWAETGVKGLRIERDGGTWVSIPLPDPSETGIERSATLQLNESGTLEGTATFVFKGAHALALRLDENGQDAEQRKKILEAAVKESIPVPADAELTNTPDWNSSSSTLVAEYHLKVPNWSSSAGRRTSLATGLFGGGEKHMFDSAFRIHPVYFEFPYSDVDDVTIVPSQDLQIANVPQPQHSEIKGCSYDLTVTNKPRLLHISRRLLVNLQVLEVKFYPTLRTFFQNVRSGDEQQVILSSLIASH